MEMYFVLTGLIVFSLAFVMWLAMFILSRGINTNLETSAESRRIVTRQLVAGILLFAISVGLGLYFTRIDRPELIPEIGPGLPVTAPMVQDEIRKETPSAPISPESSNPSVVVSAPDAEPEVSVTIEQDNLQPITQ